MLFNTEAIVIRSVAYGEAHAIVTLLTPTGKLAAMAKGAKKPQSRLTAGAQLCVQGMYSIAQRSGMGTISQVEVLNSYRSLRGRLDSAAYAAYFCELAGVVAEDRPYGSQTVYHLLVGSLERLNHRQESPDLTARVWEAKALRLLGASPDWRACVKCDGSLAPPLFYSPRDGGLLCMQCGLSLPANALKIPVTSNVPKVLHAMAAVPWERLGNISLQDSTKELVRRILQIQLTEHAGVSLKSLEFLNTLDLNT